MLFVGILGFQSVLYALLLFAFLAIRHAWRNAEAKKEEIIKLVENAAMAEMEAEAAAGAASADYSWVPVSVSVSVSVSRWYQCAVCYSPTTMRCSRCKATRYCSGKCQIIHWRQGHKDECCPPITTVRLDEENISHRVAVSETQSAFHEIEGTHAGIADSNDLCSSVNPSVAARKSFDDGYHSRLAKPVCDNTADDTAAASAHPNKTVLTPSVPLESKNSVNTEVKDSSASRRSKTNSGKNADDTGFKSKFPKTKSDTSHDVAANLGGHEHRRKFATGEKWVTDSCTCRTAPSLNSSCTDSVADDMEEEPQLSKYKEGRRSSSSSGDRLSSTTKGDLLSYSKCTKTENYHTLPAKVSSIPNLSQNVRNGLKTSMQKVVQQFRSSKESRSNLMLVENEMSFPYELFMELYCYDKVKLFPFGLTNCGNSCYANAVLQCLAYTRPLTSYLFQGFHSKQCKFLSIISS